jgi:hypothetical protein
MNQQNVIHGVRNDFAGWDESPLADPKMVIRKSQTITQEFLEQNAAMKEAQDAKFAPDTLVAARIPVGIFMDFLKRKGLSFSDGMELDLATIQKWLREEGLSAFDLTKRRLT